MVKRHLVDNVRKPWEEYVLPFLHVEYRQFSFVLRHSVRDILVHIAKRIHLRYLRYVYENILVQNCTVKGDRIHIS